MWIKRTIGPCLDAVPDFLSAFPVWLFAGPRQVGKSSLLSHHGHTRTRIDLDDLNVRARAIADPEFFLAQFSGPLIIDEIQYAPSLLFPIKRRADACKQAGVIWLTGSQSFEVMRGVRESLAGRIALLNLYGISDEEWPTPVQSIAEYQQRIFQSRFPVLALNHNVDLRETYLSSYIRTYVERDVAELLGIERRREFEIFLKLCALRVGQLVNYESLGRDAGISPNTAKTWLGVLEDSFLVKLIQPHFSNRNKRLIKTPKLYFVEPALACFLAGWRTVEQLWFGPQAGAIFENAVLSEILRYFAHRGRVVDICFARDRDGHEIDFIVETRRGVLPIEVKMGSVDTARLPRIELFAEAQWLPGHVVSMAGELPGHQEVALSAIWQHTALHQALSRLG